AEVTRILEELRAQLWSVFEEIENAHADACHDWRNAVREQIRTRALAQPLDNFLAPGGKSATPTAERFAQSACDDVYSLRNAAMLGRTAARRTHKAGRMRVIDHHQCVIALGQVADAPEVRNGTDHREDAVGRNQPGTGARSLLQAVLELLHVVVGVAVALRFAEADAVDDAGVIQRIRNNGVAFVE